MSKKMSHFTGQVALVTGGGRGIGRATALALAKLGANVALAARSASEIEEVAAMIRTNGRKALAVCADLADSSAPDALVWAVEQGLGPVTILINVAGSAGPYGAAWEGDPAEWERVVHLNLVAPFLLIRQVLPAMLQRDWGKIVNVSSGAAQIPIPRMGAYSTSKAGLDMLTRQFAAELAGTGVAVTAIYPGMVDTPAMARFGTLPPDLRGEETMQRIQQMRAKGAFLNPDLPARFITAVVATAGPSLNGHVIDISSEEGQQLLAD